MKTKSARRGPYPVHTFCIITAKSDELREVKSVLKTAFRREDDDPLSGRAVYIVKERPRQPTLTLLATTCSAMGNVYAATKTAQIISLHNPSVLFFVGTAASLDPGTVRLGDVIVPNGYGYRFYDKIVEKGQKDFEKAVADKDFKERFFGDNVLLTDYFTHSLPGSAPDLISDVDFKSGVMLDDGDLAQEWQDELKKGSSMRTPKVETDVQMVTCGMVVNSEAYRTFLAKQSPRKGLVIDMESFGFFKVIDDLLRQSDSVSQGIMIRGISDYAGRKETTELGKTAWKTVAVRNAAKVAASAIKQLAEIS